MKMKKIISAVLSAMMLAAMCIPALAADDVLNAYEQQRLEQLESVAYMNLDEANVEMSAQILAAREEIIYSHSWVADGVSGRIRDKNGNIKSELPQFSELFPADWSMPSWHIEEPNTYSFDIDPVFSGSVWLKVPSSIQNSPIFCSFPTTGRVGTSSEYNVETVYTQGLYQNPTVNASYNVGYTNAVTYASLGWGENLSNSESFEIDPPKGISVGVRASTYDSIGNWGMSVNTKNVYVN